MRIIDLPQNEEQRLLELYSYDILDTEHEKEFDSIALLAAEICDTAYAKISLVDRNKQWLKAKFGFKHNETERLFAFCNYTIQNSSATIVTDATVDDRFKNNPYVVGEPNIKFYAGFPLITPKGFCIGSLAVADTQSKTLSDAQLKTLSLFAKQVINLMEIRKKNIEIQKTSTKYKNLLDNLNEGYFVDDLNGNVVFANKKFLEIFELSKDDLNNFSIDDYVAEESIDEVKNRHLKRINGEEALATFEYRGKKKNGKKIWIRANVENLYQENKIIGTQTLLSDITAEKNYLAEIKKKDATLSAYFNSETDAVFIINKDLKIIGYNKVYQKFLSETGINSEIEEGKSILEYIQTQNHEKFLQNFNKCLLGNTEIETLYVNYNNKKNCWKFTFVPVKDEQNKIIAISFIAKDITLENELSIKNSNYNDLLEALNMINSLLLGYDNAKNINYSICDILVNIANFNMAWIGWVNEVTQQVEPVSVYGDKYNYVKNIKVYADERPEGMGPIGISIRENQYQIVRNADKHSSLKIWQEERNKTGWQSSIAMPIIFNNKNKGVLVVYSIHEDYFGHKEILALNSIVTNYIIAHDRYQLKKNIIEKDYFLNTIANNAPALLSFWDKNSICKFANSEFVNWLGLHPVQLVGKHYKEIYGNDLYIANQKLITDALAGNRQIFEKKLVKKDGTVGYFSVQYVPHIVLQEVVGFCTLAYDITKLKEQKNKLQFDASILKNIHDAILISDVNREMIFYNAIAENMFGYTESEVLGKKALFIQHPEGEEKADEIYEEVLSGKVVTSVWKCLTKNNKTIWLKINSSPFYNDDNKIVGVIGSCIDVSEQQTSSTNNL
ncbi:MAG: PAS domain S-box protein [Bacteroidota bacterium]